jgi:hypothetical protein
MKNKNKWNKFDTFLGSFMAIFTIGLIVLLFWSNHYNIKTYGEEFSCGELGYDGWHKGINITHKVCYNYTDFDPAMGEFIKEYSIVKHRIKGETK